MSIKAKIAEELASRVKGGDNIAMDFASRMQRAKKQGFDTDTVRYHGTNKDLSEFTKDGQGEFEEYGDYIGRGIFTSTDPSVAQRYAERAAKEGGGNPVIYPFFTKSENPLVINSQKDFDMAIKDMPIADEYLSYADRLSPEQLRRRSYDDLEPSEQEAYMISKGYDGLVDNTYNQSAVLNPNQIRSTNAAFDPAKKDSSNLLAEMGAGIGAATTLPWMAKRAEAAEQERISAQIDESIGNMSRGQTIEAPINPYYQTAADAVGKYNRAIKGSPAEYLLGAEGLEDYLRHGAYGEADMFDRGTAALNIAELFAAPAEGLKYLGKITD